MSNLRNMDEKELIKKLKKKDSEAQKYLYDKYSALFYGICLRYSYSNDEAEDILQEGFIKILCNVKKYSGKGSFEGWMRRIIINNAINYYHKNHKHRYHYDIDDVIQNYVTEEYVFKEETKIEYSKLLKIIQELAPRYKEIFNLFAIEGLKHREIAKMLKISENTSKSHYHRARKILQKKLKDIIKNT